MLGIASAYYTQSRYPSPVHLPPKEQVREILDFAKMVFARVCQILEIDDDRIQ